VMELVFSLIIRAKTVIKTGSERSCHGKNEYLSFRDRLLAAIFKFRFCGGQS
jgi:hypothetical protein